MTERIVKLYYVYEHWRPDMNVPFYVGKGNKNRIKLVKRRTNKHHCNICSLLEKNGMGVEIKIVCETETEHEAFVIESLLIESLSESGVNLVNITKGGDGLSGFNHSEETKRKMSVAAAGKTKSEQHIKSMRISKLYSQYPDSFKEKCRNRMTGPNNPLWGKPSNMRGKKNLGVAWYASCVRNQHYWGC